LADLQIDLAVAGTGRAAALSGLTPDGREWLVRLANYAGLQVLTEA